jgi:hypothetical protein
MVEALYEFYLASPDGGGDRMRKIILIHFTFAYIVKNEYVNKNDVYRTYQGSSYKKFLICTYGEL